MKYLHLYSLSQKIKIPLLIIICSICCSFRFYPISANLDLKSMGNDQFKAEKIFHIENMSDQDIPVEVTLMKRNADQNGKEIRRPAEKNFQVFPQQFILKSKQKRAIKVSWKGSLPEHEKAYRLIVEQLPINLEDEKKEAKQAKASVKVLLKYIASLYLTPTGVEAEIDIDPIKIDAQGQKLLLTLINRGGRHKILKNPMIDLFMADNNQKISIDKKILEKFNDLNLLAKSQQTIQIHWPKQLPKNTKSRQLKAKIYFEK